MWQPGWKGSLGMERGGGMDTYIYTAESLHCSPETITTLLFGYPPPKNKKFLKMSSFQQKLMRHAKNKM